MEPKQLINIQILPRAANPFFEQRETGVMHTSYLEETAFYSQIQQGNTEMVQRLLSNYLTSAVVVGRLSENPVRQMRYWAVCCITLGTRYAIQGGLEEMLAFHVSDQSIMRIDQLDTPEGIVRYLGSMVLELTELVRKNAHRNCPAPVKKCLHYIDSHLHETVSLGDLAELTGLSEAYLSRLFRKYAGQNVKQYIMRKKLETAREMLGRGCGQREVAYDLGFCSQTYFITCFKKAYGVTPHQYATGQRDSK